MCCHKHRYIELAFIVLVLLVASACREKISVTGEINLTLATGSEIKPSGAWVYAFPADGLRAFVQKPEEMERAKRWRGNLFFSDLVITKTDGGFSLNLLPGKYGLIAKAKPATSSRDQRADMPTYYWLVWFEVKKNVPNRVTLTNENALPDNSSESLRTWIENNTSEIENASENPNSSDRTSRSSGSGSEAYRVASRVSARLDITTASEMLEQIPVGPSSQERIGSRRKITWTFSDGSKIVATFKPLGGEGSNLGLVLYAVEIR